ncbi:MAG: hypothetical protein GY805_06870, partial [Chloroflexi bacterium]|nr:hypothetical protein [Chloroflexota bacterium]
MKESVATCSACGNALQNGRCSRCEANAFTRQRRWRTGDKGGKRPERQHTSRTFQDALDGIWRNSRRDILVHIDIDDGAYCSQHGRKPMTSHRFQMVEEGAEQFTFYKDEMLVETAVSDMGFLIMAAKNKRMAFAYEFDEELFRTCPLCYTKS